MAKILVIDDEDIVLSVIGQSLKRVGHQVFVSKTIEEGLNHAATLERIDLLILNHSIEGIKGRELADRIKAQHPEVKTLRISGYPREKLVAEGNIRPDAEFLRKPFLPEVLRYKVEKLLTRPAPRT